jgi:hypothetical protein
MTPQNTHAMLRRSWRLLQERVRRALVAERAAGSVAAQERYVVAKRQQLLFDRADQGLVTASPKVERCAARGKAYC